jgi:hypothetical protein
MFVVHVPICETAGRTFTATTRERLIREVAGFIAGNRYTEPTARHFGIDRRWLPVHIAKLAEISREIGIAA